MAKRKRRRFTPEFKAEVVLEALRGESSQAELCWRTPQPQRKLTLKVEAPISTDKRINLNIHPTLSYIDSFFMPISCIKRIKCHKSPKKLGV